MTTVAPRAADRRFHPVTGGAAVAVVALGAVALAVLPGLQGVAAVPGAGIATFLAMGAVAGFSVSGST